MLGFLPENPNFERQTLPIPRARLTTSNKGRLQRRQSTISFRFAFVFSLDFIQLPLIVRSVLFCRLFRLVFVTCTVLPCVPLLLIRFNRTKLELKLQGNTDLFSSYRRSFCFSKKQRTPIVFHADIFQVPLLVVVCACLLHVLKCLFHRNTAKFHSLKNP